MLFIVVLISIILEKEGSEKLNPSIKVYISDSPREKQEMFLRCALKHLVFVFPVLHVVSKLYSKYLHVINLHISQFFFSA